MYDIKGVTFILYILYININIYKMATLEEQLLKISKGKSHTLTQEDINKNFFLVRRNTKYTGKIISLLPGNFAKVYTIENKTTNTINTDPVDGYKVYPIEEPYKSFITRFLEKEKAKAQEYEEIRQAAQELGGLRELRELREGRLSAAAGGGSKMPSLSDTLAQRLRNDPRVLKELEAHRPAFEARRAMIKEKDEIGELSLPYKKYETKMLDWNKLYIVSRFADFQEECEYFIYEPKRGILYYNIQLVDLNLDDEVPNLILKNIQGGPEIPFPIGKKQYLFLRTRRNKVCALPECNATKYDEGVELKKCQKCMSIFYCSKEHQIEDWSRHHPECKVERRMNKKLEELLIIISNDKLFVLKMLSLCRNATRDCLVNFQRFIQLYNEDNVGGMLGDLKSLKNLKKSATKNQVIKVKELIQKVDESRKNLDPLLEEVHENRTFIEHVTEKAQSFAEEMCVKEMSEETAERLCNDETITRMYNSLSELITTNNIVKFKEDNPHLSFEESNIYGSLLCDYANKNVSYAYQVFRDFFDAFAPENDIQNLNDLVENIEIVPTQISNLMWICDPLLDKENFTSDIADPTQDCIGGGACTSRKEEYDRLRELVRSGNFVDVYNDFHSGVVSGDVSGGAVMSPLVPQEDDELGGGRSRKSMKRKYMKRKSMKRKSMKRKSMKRKSKRKSIKKYKRKTI